MSDRIGGYIRPGYDPIQVPNPPTLNSAGGSASAALAFTAPPDVGGGAITSYIALATNTSTGATVSVTGTSSPLAFSGLTVGVSYAFTVVAVNAFGPSAASNTITQTIIVEGQSAYTTETTGSYTFVVPSGVTSISIVAIGGGAGADSSNSGGAGGLKWINNVSVTAGQSLTVFQGNTGSRFRPGGGGDGDATASYVNDASNNLIIQAGGGTKSSPGQGGAISVGSGYTSLTNGGGAGGNGGSSKGGGGGAGGYSGAGGAGGNQGTNNGAAGSGGGAGGGGGANTADGGQGGGTGILGEGSSGAGGAYGNYASPGQGGSGGTAGNAGYGNWSAASANYGGGCGAGSGGASRGAVRIIWPGATRSFPSTNTGDV